MEIVLAGYNIGMSAGVGFLGCMTRNDRQEPGGVPL
jgi:hypothetical protein